MKIYGRLLFIVFQLALKTASADNDFQTIRKYIDASLSELAASPFGQSVVNNEINLNKVSGLMTRTEELLKQIEYKKMQWMKMKEREKYTNDFKNKNGMAKEVDSLTIEEIEKIIEDPSFDFNSQEKNMLAIKIGMNLKHKVDALKLKDVEQQKFTEKTARDQVFIDVADIDNGASIVYSMTSDTYRPRKLSSSQEFVVDSFEILSEFLQTKIDSYIPWFSPILSSAGYQWRQTRRQVHEMTRDFQTFVPPSENGPEKAISNTFNIGECWACEMSSDGNSTCDLTVQFRTNASPERFALDHLSRHVARNIESAPRKFKVYGITSLNTKHEELLGEYEYDIFAEEKNQVFERQQWTDVPSFEAVKLKIESNYGFPYTCLYRFKVLA